MMMPAAAELEKHALLPLESVVVSSQAKPPRSVTLASDEIIPAPARGRDGSAVFLTTYLGAIAVVAFLVGFALLYLTSEQGLVVAEEVYLGSSAASFVAGLLAAYGARRGWLAGDSGFPPR
eukprot:RCo025290